jgi:hypothetical protein
MEEKANVKANVKSSDVATLAEQIMGMVGGFDRVYLKEAEVAATRASEAAQSGNAEGVAGATATAVLLSASACEARLSEYVTVNEKSLGDDTVKSIRNRNKSPAEKWASLLSRLAPSHDLQASEPYKSLECLYKVRNLVAHRNARMTTPGTWPKGLHECVQSNVVPVAAGAKFDWTSATFVQEVAHWASDTATRWLEEMDRRGVRVR